VSIKSEPVLREQLEDIWFLLEKNSLYHSKKLFFRCHFLEILEMPSLADLHGAKWAVTRLQPIKKKPIFHM
jgi:hypothetical protein